MMSLQDKLQVEAIRNGTVIDHIPSPIGFDILRFLKLENSNKRMTVGINLPSSNMKTKDIIKIENVFLPENKANQLALFSQNITINQIKDFTVIKKYKIILPRDVLGIFSCPNPNCITNHEKVRSYFKVTHHNDNTLLKCHYCEKSYQKKIITQINYKDTK